MGGLMSTVKANDLTNVTGGIPTVKSQHLIPTAWVNFNGTGTVAIRGSENISSLTDQGTGNYIINFTNNMANSLYCMATGIDEAQDTGAMLSVDSRAVGSFRALTRNNGTGLSDQSYINVIVLGEQA